MRNVTYFLTGALLILAVGGYLLPEKSEPLPNRILMNNTAGRVVFDHGAHAEKLGIECQTCHHDALKAGQAGQNCKSCHGLEFDASFKGHSYTMAPSTCATCHHMMLSQKKWGHSRHAKDLNIECTACHHGPQIEATPQNCANCHDRKTDMGPILSLKNAVHTRCASCHDEAFKEGSMASCTSCHTATASRDVQKQGKLPKSALVPCSTCHDTEPSRLVPGVMSAYHGLCITCHEKQGGPVDNCAQCHTK